MIPRVRKLFKITYVSAVLILLLVSLFTEPILAATNTVSGTGNTNFNASGYSSSDTTVPASQVSLTPTSNWWSANYVYRKQITITASTDALSSGYSVNLTFDHASLVTASKSLAGGDDVRIVYWNGAANTEIDRVLDGGSSWNNASTQIWFKTQAAISASASDNNYYLYYGYTSASNPPAQMSDSMGADSPTSKIFVSGDDFNEHSNGDNPDGWSLTETSGGDVRVTSQTLEGYGNGGCEGRAYLETTNTQITGTNYLVSVRWKWISGFTGGNDNIAFHITNGVSLVLRVNPLSGEVDLDNYKDGNWHTTKIIDNGTTAKVYIDDVEKKSASSSEGAHALVVQNYGCTAFDAYEDDIYFRNYVATDSSISTSLGSETGQYPSSGTWTSPSLDLTNVTSWTSLQDAATLNGGTISYETQSSTDNSSWSSWEAVTGSEPWTIASPARRYLKIRATLTSNATQSATPTLTEITATYVSNQNPTAPSSLGPAGLVDGSWTTDNTPTPTFTLSDPDAADTVKFRIQIDDSADFSSAVVDYTSALAAQGATSFTVGQAAGSETYTTGTAGQTLSDGSYYWRVKAIDDDAAESSYSTANSGAIAFKVDTTAPTVSSVASTPTSSGTTITWTTNESSSSKIDYGLTNSYGSSTNETDTSPRVTSHSVTLSGLVACATYHYRVRSKDSASNETIDSDNTFTTTGCLGEATVSSQTTSSVTTTSGGTVALTSSNTGVTLTIPASFTNSDANFQIKQLDYSPVITTATPPSGYSIIGNYTYDLKALSDVTTTVPSFSKQITIQITYTAAEIGGIEEHTLKTYRWDGSRWQELSGCTLDTTSKTVNCTTTAFSVFALFGQPSSSSATVLSTTAVPGCGDTAPGPKAPWLYGALAQGQDTIFLYFTHADGPVEKYVLEYGLTSGNYLWGAGDIGGRNTRTYLVQSLEPNMTYYFKVRASNGCATGSWSNEISAKTTTLSGPNFLPLPSIEKLEQTLKQKLSQPTLPTPQPTVNPLTGRPLSFPKITPKLPKIKPPTIPTIELVWLKETIQTVGRIMNQASRAIDHTLGSQVGKLARKVEVGTNLFAQEIKENEVFDFFYRVRVGSELFVRVVFTTEPTRITEVTVANLLSTSTVISWKTNTHGRSKVNYGFDTSYGLKTFDDRYVKDHFIKLENLEPGKTYYFEVMSQGIDYVYDAYYTFTTPNQPED